MYSIKEVDPTEWDVFLKTQTYTPFVQSPTYGEFYASLGESYWIFGLYRGDELIGGSIVLSTHARRGNFLYLPYGPILDYAESKQIHTFVSYLQHFAKEKKYDFIRISPLLDDTKEGRGAIRQYGFRPAPMHVLAENSWLLDLSKSEEALLSEMKKNHRNLIRRCERDGVVVTTSTEGADLDVLTTMLETTEKRHNFTRFSDTYINNEFELFAKKGEALLFTATLPNGDVDAAAVIMFFGNMAVYRHSASLNLDKKHPASYLIQWEVINEAKRRGMRWYNFWGVEPAGAKNHPFAGIGHFKRGFGGFQKDLLHCHDLPLTKKYWLNWIIETMRRIKRGF